MFSIEGCWRRFDLAGPFMPEACFSDWYWRCPRSQSLTAKKIESSTLLVAEEVERHMRSLTTFIIVHRLCALKHSEILIRIEHGRLLSARPTRIVGTEKHRHSTATT